MQMATHGLAQGQISSMKPSSKHTIVSSHPPARRVLSSTRTRWRNGDAMLWARNLVAKGSRSQRAITFGMCPEISNVLPCWSALIYICAHVTNHFCIDLALSALTVDRENEARRQ